MREEGKRGKKRGKKEGREGEKKGKGGRVVLRGTHETYLFSGVIRAK